MIKLNQKNGMDSARLQDMVPLNSLTDERFREIATDIRTETIGAGRFLFGAGDCDNRSIYLLDGEVNFIDANGRLTGLVSAGTEPARYPIANQQPRLVSARAATRCVIAVLDSTLLDVMLTLDQTAYARPTTALAEGDTGAGEDWMTRMLHSPAFIKLAPVEIQRLMHTLTPVRASVGEKIIRQGEEGNYFYIIRTGKFSVTRKIPNQDWEVPLAELSDGDCFGEEALVSDDCRNATVTSLTDGHLMRLSKKQFLDLLKKPLVHYIDIGAARALVDNGGTWLDVRLPDECSNAMASSVNIPLADIRKKTSDLSTDRNYILCCDTGRRSAAAAFLLSQRGFEVNVLEGGLNALTPVSTPNPAAITAAPSPASPEPSQSYDWSIEPLDGDEPADNHFDEPAALSELEAVKQQRDALEKRVRELEMQLALKSVTTESD
ncbi:MAG: cyclic nucleotide-binding domain-containing protein [Gammaproteobacteria bacterium]|nr:cyclic nucleotide-binding domain-containing protein [Gammaproteobacteria bacterium]